MTDALLIAAIVVGSLALNAILAFAIGVCLSIRAQLRGARRLTIGDLLGVLSKSVRAGGVFVAMMFFTLWLFIRFRMLEPVLRIEIYRRSI